MAIEMIGAVYCPLSSQDPFHRLHTLVEQTHCHLVLVHDFTRQIFDGHCGILDIDLVLNTENEVSENDRDSLSNVTLSYESIAYILFTSGSTGTPKAVSHLHNPHLTSSIIETPSLYRPSFDIEISSNGLDLLWRSASSTKTIQLFSQLDVRSIFISKRFLDH